MATISVQLWRSSAARNSKWAFPSIFPSIIRFSSSYQLPCITHPKWLLMFLKRLWLRVHLQFSNAAFSCYYIIKDAFILNRKYIYGYNDLGKGILYFKPAYVNIIPHHSVMREIPTNRNKKSHSY